MKEGEIGMNADEQNGRFSEPGRSMTMRVPWLVAAAIALAGCSNTTPAQQQATLTAVTQAGVTLGSLAARTTPLRRSSLATAC
jgi:hypothetical protein